MSISRKLRFNLTIGAMNASYIVQMVTIHDQSWINQLQVKFLILLQLVLLCNKKSYFWLYAPSIHISKALAKINFTHQLTDFLIDASEFCASFVIIYKNMNIRTER